MMTKTEIDLLVDSVKDPNHYLLKAKNNKSVYYEDFISASSKMQTVMSEKDFKHWIDHKVLLREKTFNEKVFIQFATETSAACFFIDRNSKQVKLEAKINPSNNKDVDIQFRESGYTFNIEVKCATFDEKEKSSSNKYTIITMGRLPDRGNEAFDILSKCLNQDTCRGKNMDNNLKDFLLNANKKFCPTNNEHEINVLLIGCGAPYNIQEWYSYLYAEQGLFRNDSFANKQDYKLVDLVILTDLYDRNHNYHDSTRGHSWNLSDSFNIIYKNPFRELRKDRGIDYFITKVLPNETTQLNDYYDHLISQNPNCPNEACFIPHYAHDILKWPKERLY